MSLISKEQLASRLKESESILITASQTSTVEQLSSGIALAKILETLDKQVVFACDKEAPKTLEFLGFEEISASDIEFLRDFVITCDKELIKKFHYAKEGDSYQILLTPAFKKTISKENLKYEQGSFNIDLILTLDVSNQSEIDPAVGKYEQLIEGSVPMVNITHRAGSMNVDTWYEEASFGGLATMIYELSQYLKVTELTTQTANALLTSIVSCTNHFTNSQTQPQTMYVAGELLKFGANPQDIAESLVDCELALAAEIVDPSEESAKTAMAVAEDEVAQLQSSKPRIQRQYISEGDIRDNTLKMGKARANKKQEEVYLPDEVVVDASGKMEYIDRESDRNELDKAEESIPADVTTDNQSNTQLVTNSNSRSSNNSGQRVIQPLPDATQLGNLSRRNPISGNNSVQAMPKLQDNINIRSSTTPSNEIEGYELSNLANNPSTSPINNTTPEASMLSPQPPQSQLDTSIQSDQAVTLHGWYNQTPSTPVADVNSVPVNDTLSHSPSPHETSLPPQAIQEDGQSSSQAPLDAPPLASMT